MNIYGSAWLKTFQMKVIIVKSVMLYSQMTLMNIVVRLQIAQAWDSKELIKEKQEDSQEPNLFLQMLENNLNIYFSHHVKTIKT